MFEGTTYDMNSFSKDSVFRAIEDMAKRGKDGEKTIYIENNFYLNELSHKGKILYDDTKGNLDEVLVMLEGAISIKNSREVEDGLFELSGIEITLKDEIEEKLICKILGIDVVNSKILSNVYNYIKDKSETSLLERFFKFTCNWTNVSKEFACNFSQNNEMVNFYFKFLNEKFEIYKVCF